MKRILYRLCLYIIILILTSGWLWFPFFIKLVSPDLESFTIADACLISIISIGLFEFGIKYAKKWREQLNKRRNRKSEKNI